jgi:diaminohydroxyphosphoribosylaminopyrimidine deaminase/5-amino-6-(5-phosphoribosylamino)uracil reductase
MSPSPANDDAALEPAMRRALRLAWRGRGWVEPNPMVGALLLRDGCVIGQGFHRRFGGPHAEVEALADCARRGHDPRGATLVVTLEPCCHHGKTPPCTEAVIQAGVSRVVAAMVDPFPRVAGGGLQRLRDAGVAVSVGLCEEHARRLNAPFIHRVVTGMPWVIAKWAQTLDGKIADRHGVSKWISNERSRRLVHHLRARVDAVMVGIGTVLADDPRLTARDVPVRRVARRVVIDPQLKISQTAALLRDVDQFPLTIATSKPLAASRSAAQLQQRGAEVLALPPLPRFPRFPDSTRLDLAPLLKHLADAHGATNVMVEGGTRLLTALLAQSLIQEAWCFVAPRVMGDAEGLPAFATATPRPLRLQRVQRLDDDTLLRYIL